MRWRRRALTLIELMVALTVSAVIFLATLQAFQQGRLAQARADARLAGSARQYDLWRLLSGDVADSFVLQAQDDTGNWTGSAMSMRFLAVCPEGRPMQIDYTFKKADSSVATGQLVRSTRLCSGSVPVGAWDALTVAEDLATFQLRFAQATEGSDSLVWTTDFAGSQAPPKAVEVQLSWTTADGGITGPLRWVIPIRAELPAGGGS